MTCKVLDSAFIYNFYDDGPVTTEIRSAIEKEAGKFASQVNDKKIQDWEVCFRAYYNNVKKIMIYLKGRSIRAEKYKEITIHVPMPVKSQAPWGIDQEQHVYENPDHLDDKIKNFHCLDVDYSKFTNRYDYIYDSLHRAVVFCFYNGFTINGVKVKVVKISTHPNI